MSLIPIMVLWLAVLARGAHIEETEEEQNLDKRSVESSLGVPLLSGYSAPLGGGHLVGQVVEVQKTIGIPHPVPVAHPVPIPVPVPISHPVPITVPVGVPQLRTVPIPVPKPVPYPVVKHVPFEVVKKVPVPVPKPYPVPYPVYKTKHVYHDVKIIKHHSW